ncbi:MAG: hypothetical protein JJ863_00215 [Deltaproteobacteria bacterium]|nr:hypothetical protein [Deltaproteobacteria bacterium]
MEETMNAAETIEEEAKHAEVIELRARIVVDERPWWLKLEVTRYARKWTAGKVDQWGPQYAARASDFKQPTVAKALAHAKAQLADAELRPGTVEISVKKGRVTGAKLKDEALEALCEAWGIAVPDAKALKAAQKEFREEKKTEKAEKAGLKQKVKDQEAKRVAAAQVESRPDEKVTDLPSFLKGIESRADRSKLRKALKMLKADRFELFNDVRDTEVIGVVKSQTDAKLRYACRLGADGSYSCCTQNLNVCGGLRGSMCKHLLVLVVGLVQARELDPTLADAWIEKTIGIKALLDRDAMSEVFLRYQGAEAGEVDWRPTETVPEDFYAF